MCVCVCVCVCVYNWVTLLYSRYKHNIINQLYFNFFKNFKIKSNHILFTKFPEKECHILSKVIYKLEITNSCMTPHNLQ